MINDLIKLATHLDSKGLHKEADYVDSIVRKWAELVGDQHEIDADGDKKITEKDFEILREKGQKDSAKDRKEGYTKKCPHCGTMNKPSAKRCRACNGKL
tara:strand:+ start:446 stop:742 length:297 start_codon:yes stop_codon:yes gene_type:complete